MDLSQFDYDLPEELIAQRPLAHRDGARMLVVDREKQAWTDAAFRDLPNYCGPGDCLVVNNSRVIPSRLEGRRPGHPGRVEIFLVEELDPGQKHWRTLVRPARKLAAGSVVEIGPGFRVHVLEALERGERIVRLETVADCAGQIEKYGHMPLPPYIRRTDETQDRDRYQTIYAGAKGSVAAPTAGLHFTPEVLSRVRAAGADVAEVTLHVGLGTFLPLRLDRVEANMLHRERFAIDEDAAQRIRSASRLVAVGTTAARTLESAGSKNALRAVSGETDIFIYPGYRFQSVDAMLTNFHLPRSSLLLLVSAFGGTELLLEAYRYAVRSRYRFFSYGDCMLIK